MLIKPRILFSMPTRHHVEIAADEMEGLIELGYTCAHFRYAAKDGATSKVSRLRVIIENAVNLVKVARQFKPDIIYLNSRLEILAGVRDMITIAIFKSFYKPSVRFMVKSHGSDIKILKSTSFLTTNVLLPFLKKNVAAWLFLSTEEKKKVIEINYFDAKKLFVTKNIVRIDQFKPYHGFKQGLNIVEDATVLLFVGRIIKEKGVYEVIEAFAQIKDQYNVVLIIVGWGSELENLRQMSESLGIAHQVIFTGFIPEQEVVPFYANCDVLIFPTFFPEGFPMALFNSVSAGMAIITTPTRAAADFLSEPENCLWVKPQNSDNVKQQLTELLRSELLLNQMKANNKAKGYLFGKKQVCLELAGILNQIID